MAEQGKPSTRAKNKYNAKTYDQFLVTVPAGEKAEIDKAAEKSRLTAFVSDSVTYLY